jgi:hypothetical protein
VRTHTIKMLGDCAMSSELNRIDDIDAWLRVIELQCAKIRGLEVCDRTVSLTNLYREAMVEANRLKTGKDEIVLTCSAVRNIFELMVIIKYLAGSDEAIKCWIGQLQRDTLDIHDGLVSLFQKHGIRSIELENSRSNVLANGDAHGVSPSKPFRIRDIAKELGLVEDYDAMYKLYSKIVHPSSVRVNLPGAFEKNGNYKDALIHTGVHYLAQIAESSKRDFA